LVFITLHLFFSFLIILRYIQNRQRVLFFIGISWLGLALPWIPEASIIFFYLWNVQLTEFQLFLYWAIFIVLLQPFILILWVAAMTNLLKIEERRRITILITIFSFCMIFEFIFLYSLFNDTSIIGQAIVSTYFVVLSDFVIFYIIVVISIMLLFGFLVARRGLMRSEQPEAKLKAKFFLIALILFPIGTVIDLDPTGLLVDDQIHLIVAKYILAVCSVFLYMGFMLPAWIKKKFLK